MDFEEKCAKTNGRPADKVFFGENAHEELAAWLTATGLRISDSIYRGSWKNRQLSVWAFRGPQS